MNEMGYLQCRHNVFTFFRGTNTTFHLDLVGPSQSNASESIFHDARQMCLVNDRKHIIGTLNGHRYEARILSEIGRIGEKRSESPSISNDEYVVLRIRDDGCLVLRYLYHSKTLEFDDGIRDSRNNLLMVYFIHESQMRLRPLTPAHDRAHQFLRGKPG